MAATFCSNCGGAVEDDAKFCASCGHAISQRAGESVPAAGEGREKAPLVVPGTTLPQKQSGGGGGGCLKAIGGAVVVLIAIGAISAMVGRKSGTVNLTGLGGSSAGSGATQVTFEVNGNAPNGIDITYGNDGSNYQGSLPLYKTLTIEKNAMYYDITAQLSGGGAVNCSVTIGNAVATGHARGGYNICSAQLNSDFSGGWVR
jgi:hypothetical protein